MYRKNKFRVWCKNKKEWERNECFLSEDGDVYQFEKGVLTPMSSKTHTTLLFTGLHDKYGFEIYDGDIVGFDRENKEIGVVSWDSYMWVVKLSGSRTMYFNNPDAYEVIGNVYENSRLLEGK